VEYRHVDQELAHWHPLRRLAEVQRQELGADGLVNPRQVPVAGGWVEKGSLCVTVWIAILLFHVGVIVIVNTVLVDCVAHFCQELAHASQLGIRDRRTRRKIQETEGQLRPRDGGLGLRQRLWLVLYS
jgi:hypothetical protein